jgi:prepilin-type N-terminal cleavage/methylation domain-containing protein
MMTKTRARSGFTLVETMVVTTILVSISLITTLWLNGISDLWWTTSVQSQLRTFAQQGVSRAVAELRTGTRTGAGSPPNATIPASPNNTSITFYVPTDNDANGTIIDAFGNIEWNTVNAVVISYNAGTRQLQRTQNGATTILANDVEAVTFEDVTINNTLNNNEVRINMTLQRTTPQRRVLTANAVEVVKLRN